jgi:NAD(P)-dependent dehydrogenase (short-subunit alcohol dehydrogenase family)
MHSESLTGARLEGKVAIVTGGASGIGEGISMEFAAQGARIAIADRDAAGSAAVAGRIRELGGEAMTLEVDVTDHQATADSARQVVGELGGIDILVNCAGTNRFAPPEEYTSELWETVRSVDLDGSWNFCNAVMPEMMGKRSGKIINIGSGSSVLAIANAAAYVAAKHGVAGLTKALAVDLGPYNVNVNCICPTTIRTPLVMAGTTEAFRKNMLDRIPMGRLCLTSDIAKAAVFLASSDSEFITGVILPVDGGFTCCTLAHHL